jgi:DNA-binding NtrC family response regulator
MRATILIVEDEPIQRRDMQRLLTTAGYGVVTARNGEQALAILGKRRDIDVVVTDVRMPGDFDGMIVAWRAAKKCPVVVVSAFLQPARGETTALPAPILNKPLDRAAFLEEVHKAAKRAPLCHEANLHIRRAKRRGRPGRALLKVRKDAPR